MFFYGSDYKERDPHRTMAASLALAWSDDLKTWDWPGKAR